MIEIKEGWTALEATTQHDIGQLNWSIASLNRKLEEALASRARLQLACKHNHVLVAGQQMTCEVCGARVDG